MANEELFFSGIDLQNRGEAKGVRLTKRSSSEASNATPSVNSNLIDIHLITALAVAMTSFTVTGTPTDGQELIISITDNGVDRALAFGANFEASGLPLPTTTVASERLDMQFRWNAVTSKWRLFSMSTPIGETLSSMGDLINSGTDITAGSIQLTDSFAMRNASSGDLADMTVSEYNDYLASLVKTLTNKRITPRVVEITSSATPTIDIGTTDQFIITALAANTTIAVTGTPTDSQMLRIAITDNATSRTLTFSSDFEAGQLSLPTKTPTSIKLEMFFIYNNATSKWRLQSRTNSIRSSTTVTQSATPTINTNITAVAHITGLAQDITSFTTNLSGNANEGDTLRIDITDNGTARAITWGSSFESSGSATLPTTTVLGVRVDIGFVWNSVTSKWRCLAVA